ncbi:MAG TPA: FtsX-like permease family protein [Bryobacteraceae bacterium]|nr:FtsX-like permease family protein [Bryobacteraceae bacterium]
MKIRLITGRTFQPGDNAFAPRVAIVNQTLARSLFGNTDAIGRQIIITRGQQHPARTIVGIVADTKQVSLAQKPSPQMYEPFLQEPDESMTILVRSVAGNPLALAEEVRSRIWAVDKELSTGDPVTMENMIGDSVGRRRITMLMIGAFGLVAMLLAAIGVYGVISFGVAQRTREIGIRMALGANPGHVLREVVGQSAGYIGLGLLFGVACAVGLTRFLTAMLFDVSAVDPVTYLAAGALLVGAALAASYVPALRASKVDPIIAMRQE